MKRLLLIVALLAFASPALADPYRRPSYRNNYNRPYTASTRFSSPYGTYSYRATAPSYGTYPIFVPTYDYGYYGGYGYTPPVYGSYYWWYSW